MYKDIDVPGENPPDSLSESMVTMGDNVLCKGFHIQLLKKSRRLFRQHVVQLY